MTASQPQTQQLQALDGAHFLHPFTDLQALARSGARVIVRGEGVRIWDSDGHEILDGMSGLWCVSLGYGRRDLVQAATHQLETLPYYNAFFKTTTPPAAQLGAKLAEVAPPGFRHVFYTGSGSEANDTNVRLVRRYWDLMGKPGKSTIISRVNAYHGSTMAGASLGGMSGMHAQGGLPIPGIVHIDQPYQLEHGRPGESEHDFGVRAASWLEQKINELGADKVGAFIGEPVQGAGGVIIPPASYWPEIQRICRKHDVLIISDEVICGFGRLGTWFGCQHPHTRFEPDLITFAKGVTSGYLPLGGVLVGERVAKVLIERGGEFNHGFTYSGHPACCAVGLACVEALQRERIVERVHDDLAPYFAQQMAALGNHPMVGDVQTLGMVGGLVLYRDKAKRQHFDDKLDVGLACRDQCFANGVVMRAVGHRMIIAPPLVMTHADVDEMLKRIRRAFDTTWQMAQAKGWR